MEPSVAREMGVSNSQSKDCAAVLGYALSGRAGVIPYLVVILMLHRKLPGAN